MVPETKVLAIASHVVYGYVGNTMATFVMQAMGMEVAAINTVNFSNHTGYRQFTGTRTPAADLTSLYTGLRQSHLTDFAVLLSGYAPSAAAVHAIGDIARDLRSRNAGGAFFWVLDPVMGDQGRLYVDPAIVPEFKTLVAEADLILPNQFEAGLLAGVDIRDLAGCREAVEKLHSLGVGMVVVTSLRLGHEQGKEGSLTVVGSTMTSTRQPRLFKVAVPQLDCFFSGTGDMFAALMVARLREECARAGLLGEKGWMSGDEVPARELPLARAMCLVLSSLQMVLEKTMVARGKEMGDFKVGESEDGEKRKHLAETKAAEVRVVRNWRALVEPEERYVAEEVILN